MQKIYYRNIILYILQNYIKKKCYIIKLYYIIIHDLQVLGKFDNESKISE